VAAASRIIRDLARCSRNGTVVQLLIHAAAPDVRELAGEILSRVPNAWGTTEKGVGCLHVELAVGSGYARLIIADVPQPPGWQKQDEDGELRAQLLAGVELANLCRAECLRAQAEAAREAAEAN
jgi:hypothetical protein